MNRPKNDKTVKIMMKTQILLQKTIESNGKLRVRVRVRFFYFSELATTDPQCKMPQTLLGRKKYKEAMSEEHPLSYRFRFFI